MTEETFKLLIKFYEATYGEYIRQFECSDYSDSQIKEAKEKADFLWERIKDVLNEESSKSLSPSYI